jgi:hypothetical protein
MASRTSLKSTPAAFGQRGGFGAGLDQVDHDHLVAGLGHLAGAGLADAHRALAQHRKNRRQARRQFLAARPT